MRATTAIMVSAVLALGACGGGTATPPSASNGPGTVVPTLPDSPTTTADAATTTSDSGAPVTRLKVGQTGFTQYEEYGRSAIVAAAEVVNVSPDNVLTGQYQATLLDESGVVLDDTQGWISVALAPGATTWVFPAFRPEEGTVPASMVVTLDDGVVADEVQVANGTMPIDAVIEPVSALVYNDINSATHIEAVFRNATDARLTTIAGACGIYRDGQLIGGALGWVNEIPPGAEAGMDVPIGQMLTAPFPADVRCSAAAVNISTYEPGVTTSGLEVVAGVTFNPAGDTTHYDTIVGVVLHNPTDTAALGVHVEVDLLDAAGQIMHVAVPSDTYVLPGETVYTGIAPIVSLDSAPPASSVPRTRVEEWADPTNTSLGSADGLDLTAHPFDVNGATLYMSVGLTMFGGTLTTTGTSDLNRPVISCAALAGGVPVAGSSWTLAEVPAGVPITFEMITSFGTVPTHDDVRCTLRLTAITEIT